MDLYSMSDSCLSVCILSILLSMVDHVHTGHNYVIVKICHFPKEAFRSPSATSD